MLKRMFIIVLSAVAAFALMLGLVSCSGSVDHVKMLTIENMDEWVKFNGRTYVNEAESSIHFDWSLGGFEINFYGTGVQAELVSSLGSSPDKNTMLYVFVDGVEDKSNPIWLNNKSETITLCENLSEGQHTLKLIKRNCVSKASAGVKSLEVLGSSKASFTEKPHDKDIFIEFVGDSITSGDGVLTPDGKADWISICQDATCSYAYHIAEEFDADVSLISCCGAGVVWDCYGNDEKSGGTPIPSVYDYACKYYDESSSKWNFDKRQPNLIVINLGTNDKNQIVNAVNKERWMSEYEKFIKHIREMNPSVPVICTYGAMIGPECDPGLEELVSKLTEEGLSDIFYKRVKPSVYIGVGGHPSAEAQRITAENEYIPFIQSVGVLNRE